jgi:hypothetical protein
LLKDSSRWIARNVFVAHTNNRRGWRRSYLWLFIVEAYGRNVEIWM